MINKYVIDTYSIIEENADVCGSDSSSNTLEQMYLNVKSQSFI